MLKDKIDDKIGLIMKKLMDIKNKQSFIKKFIIKLFTITHRKMS